MVERENFKAVKKIKIFINLLNTQVQLKNKTVF